MQEKACNHCCIAVTVWAMNGNETPPTGTQGNGLFVGSSPLVRTILFEEIRKL
jgi:hypothetical protein